VWLTCTPASPSLSHFFSSQLIANSCAVAAQPALHTEHGPERVSSGAWRNMYGPPPNCKKNQNRREQSAKMYPAS
jgi:hypothetical protein